MELVHCRDAKTLLDLRGEPGLVKLPEHFLPTRGRQETDALSWKHESNEDKGV